MKKQSKKKLWIFVAGFTLTATAIYFAFSGNWPAVLWILCTAFLLVQVILKDLVIEANNRWMQKSRKINTKLTQRLVIEQGKNEALLANCKRYQDRIKQLKKEGGRSNDKLA